MTKAPPEVVIYRDNLVYAKHAFISEGQKTVYLGWQLAELNKLRANPTSDSAIEQLRRALASKIDHVAARAAKIAAEDEEIWRRVEQLVKCDDIDLGQMIG